MRNSNKSKYGNYIIILSLLSQLIFITASSSSNYGFGQARENNVFFLRSLSLASKSSTVRYYLSAENEKESITDIGPNQYFIRRMTGDKGLIEYSNHISAFFVIGFSLFVLYFGYVINRKKWCRAILAINLGGHAPPFTLSFADINI